MQMLDSTSPDLYTGCNPSRIESSNSYRPLRFLLVTHPRTGTQMVANALEGYACVRLFNLYAIPPNSGREANYWANFMRFQWQSTCCGISHLGTVHHRIGPGLVSSCSIVDYERYWAMVAAQHDRYVCIHRENLLRQLLSRKVGTAIHSYDVLLPRYRKPKAPLITIPVEELREFICVMEWLRNDVDKHFSNPCVVTLEELQRDWIGTMHRVQDYLQLPRRDDPPFTHRQEHRPLRGSLANYDEVADWLGCNNYAHWLEEPQ